MAKRKEKGEGLMGWLGRQVGHVRKAIKADVTKGEVVYRKEKVEEKAVPGLPGVVLRRTTVDEVVKEGEEGTKARRHEGTEGDQRQG